MLILSFYSSPEQILKKMDHYSILITPHNFTPENEYLLNNGIYNVSFQSFKRDENGLACLNWWKDKCIEWCYDEVEEKQILLIRKYLDEFEKRFENVHSGYIPGCGIAPWNVQKFNLSTINGINYIDDNMLVYYHFHGLRAFKHYILTSFRHYNVKSPSHNLIKLYKNYCDRISF